MRKLLTTLVLCGAIAAFGQKSPIKMSEGYKIEITTSAICEICKEAIEYDLAFEKGVKTADLNIDNKIVTVIYNHKKTSPDVIRKRITKVGYNADNFERDAKSYEKLPECCKDGAHGDTDHPEH